MSALPNKLNARRIRSAFSLVELLLVVILVGLVLGLCLSLRRKTWESASPVAFSPDTKMLAASIERWSWEPAHFFPVDGQVKVWDVASGREIIALRGFTRVRSIAFSPQASELAILHHSRVTFWDLANQRELEPPIYSDADDCVTFRPDAESIATAGSGRVEIWTLGDRKKVRTYLVGKFQRHPDGSSNLIGDVYSIDFSQDGKFLATGGDEGVQVWDSETGELTQRFEESGPPITSVAFLRNGEKLKATNDDGTVTEWDLSVDGTSVSSQKTRSRFELVSSDGKFGVTSKEGTVVLWDAESGAIIRTLHIGRTTPYLHWSIFVLGIAGWAFLWCRAGRTVTSHRAAQIR